MSYVLASTIGVIVGCIVTQYLAHRKQGYGYFVTTQINETECTFNVRIPNAAQQELHTKSTILLKREPSRK